MSTKQTTENPMQREIGDAMREANPEIEGDLMRKLMERGVDGPVREMLAAFQRGRSRRPRYVPGWRPDST
ncbi:MAG: hypothetical protein ACJ8HI_13795 [Massilia sp.]|jgi:hypothetical protein